MASSTMANNTDSQISRQVCISLRKNFGYRGIFIDGNPLNYVVPLFMFRFILFIIISHVIYVVLRPLRQPKIVCNILAGIIIGPSVLGRSKSYMEMMFPEKEYVVTGSMITLGLVLFFFLVCIKIDPAEVFRTANKTWKIGLTCMVTSLLFTMTSLRLLHDFLPGIAFQRDVAAAFAMSSSMSFFIVVVHALDELNLLSSEIGQLSTSVTMFLEGFELTFLTMGGLANAQQALHKLYASLALGVWIALGTFVIRPMIGWINKTTPKGQLVKQGYVIAIIVWTLVIGAIMDAMGFSFIPAPIVMGLIIPAKSPLGETITHKCELVITQFLFPLFFLRTGFLTNLSGIHDWAQFVAFGIVMLVGIFGRLLGCYLVSSFLRMNKNTAILLSLILSLQGIVELLLVSKWTQKQLISQENYTTFVLGVLVINGVLTPLIEIFSKAQVSSNELLAKFHSRSLGKTSQLGELRIISCIHDQDNVPSIINLLEAMNPREVSPIFACIVHLCSLATQSFPVLVPYKLQKRIPCRPSDTDNIMRAFANYANNSQLSLHINPFKMISPVKYMHEPICRLAEETRTPLIIVPFFKSREAAHINDGTLRIFNTNIQSLARCTVGILVDRGLQTVKSSENFTYKIAVIFLGGADSREALSFTARMSRHPNVSITVLKINMIGESARGFEHEREIDDAFFRDFMGMNIANPKVVCHEVMVEKIHEVMFAINALEKGYDIIIVGKRQGCNSKFETELLDWAEYPQLGVLGDAMAAPDFHGGMMSVLVLQHCDEQNLASRRTRAYLDTQLINQS